MPAVLASAVLVGTGVTVGVAAPSAEAADTAATLTATGVVSGTYPTGGNTVWVQPGTSLTLNTALAKAQLGPVAGLLNGLLGTVTGLQANVDLSSTGVAPTTIGIGANPSVRTPALPKGVYKFTWSFTAVGTNLLGQPVSTPLSGNQLASLGIKFNVGNGYFGYIVSDTQSPCGGAQCIALQTPTLSVAPSLPVVGQLPTISVPGQNVDIPVPSVPGVNSPLPGTSSSAAAGTTAPGGATGSTSPTNPYDYTAPGCTGPCAVVPKGGGGGGEVGAAYGVTLGDLGDAAAGSGTSAGGSASGSGADSALAAAANGQGANSQLAVDRAFASNGTGATGGPGVSTSLAIAAIAALAGATVFWFARRRLARG